MKKPASDCPPLNPDTLLSALEPYADGPFEELMDIEWWDIEAFYRAGCDYIAEPDRGDFHEALFDKINRSKR